MVTEPTFLMSEPISIATFDTLPPAETLVHVLTEKGLEAGVHNETSDQTMRFFAGTHHAQFRVQVPPAQMTAALEVVANLQPLAPEKAKEDPAKLVIRCPDCGSTRVEFPQFSRNTIVGALPALAASVGLVEQDFYCQACHYTWLPQAATEKPPLSDAMS